MSEIRLKKWDSAEHLKTPQDMAMYLEACIEEAGDDAAFIAKALGNIARAKGMSQLAKDTGMGRESLYKALSGQGNPSFATILKVTRALGIRFHVQPSCQKFKQSADAFAAQAAWHERNGQPLADIMSGPGGSSWKA